MKPIKILAIILMLGGVAVLILGIYQFAEFRQSLGGRAASLGNQLSRAVGGSSRVAKGYVQPIVLIISGLVAGAAGLFLFKRN